MNDTIVGVMQKVARREMEKIYTSELALVTAVFPHAEEGDSDNYQCSVKLKNHKQPDGSDFELRRVPVAVSHLGLANIPNIGDLVLVTFVGGDINAPIVIGRLYNDEDRPPVNQSDEIVYHLPLEAEAETALKLALRSGGDHDPSRQVEVLIGQKLSARLTDGDPLVEVRTDKVAVVVSASGDVAIESEGKLLVQAATGLELKSDGSINIDAGGEMTLKSNSTINIESTGAMTLKGQTIDLN